MELIINLEVDGAFKTNKIERDIDGIFEVSTPEKEEDELNEAFKKRMQNKKINKKGLTLDQAKNEKLRLDRYPWTVPKEDLEKEKKEINNIINELEKKKNENNLPQIMDDMRVENKLILFDPGMIYDSNLGKKGKSGSKIFIDYRFSIEKMKLPKSVKKITTDIQEIVTSADLFQKVTEYNLKKLGKENRKNYLYTNIIFLVKLFLKKKTKILLNGTIYEILDNPINLKISMSLDGNIYTIEKILVIKESDSTPANIKKLKKQLKNKESKENCKDKRTQINNNSQQLFGIEIFDSESSDEEEETILDNDNLYLGPLHGKFNKGGKKKNKKKTKRKPKRKRKTKKKKLN